MEIAKALILAGRNRYERPWPSVGTTPKPLVPVANRPILFHNLEALRRAGMLEAAIALEPESARPIMAAVGTGSEWGLSIRYVRWSPRSGLNGALAAAREFVGDEPVLVEPADALHRERIHPHIAAFADDRLDAMALTVAPPGPRGEPVAGGYLFSQLAVSILLEGTQEQCDPLAGIQRHGGHVRAQRIDGCLPCHGGQDRLLDGNRRMLERLRGEVEGAAFPTCKFQGPVLVHPTAMIEHSLVRGPAIIGPGSRLSHAYVGPYTSIGADVTIEGAQIEHSIVLEGAEITHVSSLVEASVIGRGARVGRSFGLPTAIRLSVGDGAVVTLS